MNGIFRRRHLPHWDVSGHPVFITACLEGSISAAGLQQIREFREQLESRPTPTRMTDDEWEHHKQKLLFAQVDRLLDGHSSVTHLTDDRQAEIIQRAFLHFANERYILLAFVVMPSHHHWLFLPDENWAINAVGGSRDAQGRARTPREIISHSIQSYTATMCNRVRGVSGAYWQTETFDHWARDESEMLRIIDYIEQNPVKANLMDCPPKWRWSSARLRAATGVPPGQALYVG